MYKFRVYDKLYYTTGRTYMKKKLLLPLILTVALISGCSKISEDDSLLKGQEKLESHQYDEALTLLSQVLDNDPENTSARTMYMQARKMQSAEKYEKDLNYDKAIKELNFIINIDDGSKKIKRESINKKSELEKLQEIAEKEALERKENAKKTSKEDLNKLESKIIYHNKKKVEKKKAEEKKKVEKRKKEENKKEESNKENKEEVVEENKEESKQNPVTEKVSENTDTKIETSSQIQLNTEEIN